MRKFFILAIPAFVSLAMPAMPARAQTNWTGFHVGLNAGAGWGNTDTLSNFFSDATGAATPLAPVSPETLHLSSNGFVGGGQFGYDTMIGGLMIGAEADISGSTVSGNSAATGIAGPPPTGYNETQSIDVHWLTTLRARAGIEVFPGWMPYLTAGIAVAEMKGSTAIVFPSTGVSYKASNSATLMGGVVGAGLDYAVMPSLTIGFQYLYTSFPSFSSTAFEAFTPPGPSFFTRTTSYSSQLNIFRLTVNYRL